MWLWLDDAMCKGDPLEKYVLPPSFAKAMREGRIEEVDKALTRASRCDACPVAKECARDAVRENTQSIIRGGIPVPEKISGSVLRVAQSAMRSVAKGVSPSVAREGIRRAVMAGETKLSVQAYDALHARGGKDGADV